MHSLTYGLNWPGNAAFLFLEWALRWQDLMALIAGLTLPFIFLRTDKGQPRLTFLRRMVSLVSLVCLTFGTLGPLTRYGLSNLYFLHPSAPVDISLATRTWLILIVISVTGTGFHIMLRRQLLPELDKLKHRLIKKTSMERNQRTDVRNIKEVLPSTEKYNPMDFIDLEKGIFIGLNTDREPQYIPVENWQKQHADIIGTTGAGKGVASGLLLYQSILAGEGVFVMDPKDDEWAPHLFKTACEAAGKPFYLLDLRKSEYQLDFLKDITPEHLEELFIAGFSLAEKGEAADFYRIDDRRAARATASLVKPGMTLRELFHTDYVQGIKEDIKGFFGKIEELSLLNSINAKDGMSLQSVFDDGGCCYVIGSMRNSKIIAAQRMILVRLLQLAELRDRINGTPRPIAIFLDELKYHLSRPALEGLGAARDKGVHIIMAHQSIADLRDCPADLNGDSVVGAVVENAKFKLVYKLQDPDTADWVSRMTGTILVDDETRSTSTNEVLTEVIDDRRSIRQAERHFIDSNMLLNLPPFVSFVFTTTDLPRASMIAPVIVSKKPLEIFSVPQEETQFRGPLDFDDDDPADTENVG